MASLKISVKIGGLPDMKVKLKIDVENNPKTTGYFPEKTRQTGHQPNMENSLEMDPSQTEIPDITVRSGTFWRNFLSRFKTFGRRRRA